jgi:hypothetical protein
MPAAALLDQDLVVADTPSEPRIVVSLPGLYWVASQCDERGAMLPFPCRAINISTEAVALTAAAQSAVGDRAAADIEHFGRLQGRVTSLLGTQGLVMSITATLQERRRLAETIRWVERFKNREAANARGDARFTPRNPASKLILANGSCIPCRITDLSISGAAVSADITPRIGTTLVVGKIVGRVVRHLDVGFAVRFVHSQDRLRVEALATRRDLVPTAGRPPSRRA